MSEHFRLEREGPLDEGAEWLSRSCCPAGEATWMVWIVMAQPLLGLLIFGIMEFAQN